MTERFIDDLRRRLGRFSNKSQAIGDLLTQELDEANKDGYQSGYQVGYEEGARGVVDAIMAAIEHVVKSDIPLDLRVNVPPKELPDGDRL